MYSHVLKVRDLDLPGKPKSVLFALALRADLAGRGKITVLGLVRDTGFGVRIASRALRDLEDHGCIILIRGAGSRPSSYSLTSIVGGMLPND